MNMQQKLVKPVNHVSYCVAQAVQVMTKICAESERSLDYYGLFKQIMKRAPVPMSPLESLASSAVRTAHKVGVCQSLLGHQNQACCSTAARSWTTTAVVTAPASSHSKSLSPLRAAQGAVVLGIGGVVFASKQDHA